MEYFAAFAVVIVFKAAGHFNMLLAKLSEQMEEKLKNASGRDGEEVTLDTGKGVSRMIENTQVKGGPAWTVVGNKRTDIFRQGGKHLIAHNSFALWGKIKCGHTMRRSEYGLRD